MVTPTPAFGGPGPILLLLAALAFDALAGGSFPITGALPRPAEVVARIGHELDRRLNRAERGQLTLLVRGAVVALVVPGLAAVVGWLVAGFGRALSPAGLVLEFVLLTACVSLRQPWNQLRSVRRGLSRGGIAAGRQAAQALTERPVDWLDEHGVARVSLAGLARAFNQDIVAPVFWYLLFGLPGALLWVTLAALSRVIGLSDPRHELFGLTASRLDDALGFLPARLAGLLVCLASAFVPTTHPLEALRTMWRCARDHRSLNAGWTEAAFAGALGLSLGGPYRRGGVTIQETWIGQGRARAGINDLNRAAALFVVAILLLVALLALLMAALATLR